MAFTTAQVPTPTILGVDTNLGIANSNLAYNATFGIQFAGIKAGYTANIFRSTNQFDPNYTQIDSGITDSIYDDSDTSLQKDIFYYYKVQLVDSNGNKSALSKECWNASFTKPTHVVLPITPIIKPGSGPGIQPSFPAQLIGYNPASYGSITYDLLYSSNTPIKLTPPYPFYGKQKFYDIYIEEIFNFLIDEYSSYFGSAPNPPQFVLYFDCAQAASLSSGTAGNPLIWGLEQDLPLIDKNQILYRVPYDRNSIGKNEQIKANNGYKNYKIYPRVQYTKIEYLPALLEQIYRFYNGAQFGGNSSGDNGTITSRGSVCMTKIAKIGGYNGILGIEDTNANYAERIFSKNFGALDTTFNALRPTYPALCLTRKNTGKNDLLYIDLLRAKADGATTRDSFLGKFCPLVPDYTTNPPQFTELNVSPDGTLIVLSNISGQVLYLDGNLNIISYISIPKTIKHIIVTDTVGTFGLGDGAFIDATGKICTYDALTTNAIVVTDQTSPKGTVPTGFYPYDLLSYRSTYFPISFSDPSSDGGTVDLSFILSDGFKSSYESLAGLYIDQDSGKYIWFGSGFTIGGYQGGSYKRVYVVDSLFGNAVVYILDTSNTLWGGVTAPPVVSIGGGQSQTNYTPDNMWTGLPAVQPLHERPFYGSEFKKICTVDNYAPKGTTSPSIQNEFGANYVMEFSSEPYVPIQTDSNVITFKRYFRKDYPLCYTDAGSIRLANPEIVGSQLLENMEIMLFGKAQLLNEKQQADLGPVKFAAQTHAGTTGSLYIRSNGIFSSSPVQTHKDSSGNPTGDFYAVDQDGNYTIGWSVSPSAGFSNQALYNNNVDVTNSNLDPVEYVIDFQTTGSSAIPNPNSTVQLFYNNYYHTPFEVSVKDEWQLKTAQGCYKNRITKHRFKVWPMTMPVEDYNNVNGLILYPQFLFKILGMDTIRYTPYVTNSDSKILFNFGGGTGDSNTVYPCPLIVSMLSQKVGTATIKIYEAYYTNADPTKAIVKEGKSLTLTIDTWMVNGLPNNANQADPNTIYLAGNNNPAYAANNRGANGSGTKLQITGNSSYPHKWSTTDPTVLNIVVNPLDSRQATLYTLAPKDSSGNPVVPAYVVVTDSAEIPFYSRKIQLQ